VSVKGVYMGKKIACFSLIILFFLGSCVNEKNKPNPISANPKEEISQDNITETVEVDNTSTDGFVIIGGHKTRYINLSETYFSVSIVIGEGRSSDLSGIEQLQNTTHLQIALWDNRDVDFSQLRILSKLKYLYLWGLTTVPDLGGITSLIGLELKFGRIISLNGIEKIPLLERLEISGNLVPLTDISALRYLNNLKSFHFYDGYHNIDFSVFGDLPGLEEIWFGGDALTNLTGIGQAKSIKRLRLYSNTSKELDERSVYINIEEIGGITGLKELYIDESITSVEFLANNVNLEELVLIADQERDDYWNVLLPLDIKPLGNLTKLKRLTIRGFELENVDAVKKLPNLEYFDTALYESE
jgi:hypothetical protein